MLVTRGTAKLDLPPVAVTIGNFDGVHRGHQAMIARVIEASRARGLESCVLTFEPHPREFFTPATAPVRLTSLREKLELLAALGVKRTHVARFTRHFASLPARDFVDRVLVDALRARWVLIGDDFRFGAKRAGDRALLAAEAGRCGYELHTLPTVAHAGERISSSAIREALARGNLDAARALLGRPYTIGGRVVHGAKLGRQLGFATANVQMTHNRPPLFGIFAVRARCADRIVRDGVASLGYRPTVTDERKATLEVHLFNFAGDLYGRHMRVEFVEKIRDEEKYGDLDTLKAAIASDCAKARAILARAAPAGASALP
jgi:riboflavin kinase/FMN adenylyltransferase